MNEGILVIIANECASACANEPDLRERLKKAMKPVRKGHWLTTDQDMCFRGAVGGVLLSKETTEEEKARITRTLQMLRGLSAASSGIPVDFGQLMPDEDEEFEAVPLLGIWHEVDED